MTTFRSRVVKRFTESLNDSIPLLCRASEPENRFHFSWKRSRLAAAAILFAAMCAPSLGGEADVVGVQVTKEPGGALRFDVTVRHDDSGWDHYADRFEIVGPDGNVLGTRVLLHPHETEQPFTRSAAGIVVPEGVTTLRVRAHDSVHGFGGIEMIVAVPD